MSIHITQLNSSLSNIKIKWFTIFFCKNFTILKKYKNNFKRIHNINFFFHKLMSACISI